MRETILTKKLHWDVMALLTPESENSRHKHMSRFWGLPALVRLPEKFFEFQPAKITWVFCKTPHLSNLSRSTSGCFSSLGVIINCKYLKMLWKLWIFIVSLQSCMFFILLSYITGLYALELFWYLKMSALCMFCLISLLIAIAWKLPCYTVIFGVCAILLFLI